MMQSIEQYKHIAAAPERDREQKIAHLTLHGARLYLHNYDTTRPRITVHPPAPNARMLRGTLNVAWDMAGVGAPASIYHEVPWSQLQGERLDRLEWSLIEQFVRLSKLSN